MVNQKKMRILHCVNKESNKNKTIIMLNISYIHCPYYFLVLVGEAYISSVEAYTMLARWRRADNHKDSNKQVAAQAHYMAALLSSTAAAAAAQARIEALAAACTAAVAAQARIEARGHIAGPGSTGAWENSEARCTAAPRQGREDRAGSTSVLAGEWSRERWAGVPGRRAERRKEPAGDRSDGTPLPGERAGTRAGEHRESPAGKQLEALAGERTGTRAEESRESRAEESRAGEQAEIWVETRAGEQAETQLEEQAEV